MVSKCSKHFAKLKLYCENDNMPICASCVAEHCRHIFVPIKTKAKGICDSKFALIEDLDLKQSILRNISTGLIANIQELEAVSECFQNNLKKIEKEVIQQILEVRKKMLGQLEEDKFRLTTFLRCTIDEQENLEKKTESLRKLGKELQSQFISKQYSDIIAKNSIQDIAINILIYQEYAEKANQILINEGINSENCLKNQNFNNNKFENDSKRNEYIGMQKESMVSEKANDLQIQVEQKKVFLANLSEALSNKIETVQDLEVQLSSISIRTEQISKKACSIINLISESIQNNKNLLESLTKSIKTSKIPQQVVNSSKHACMFDNIGKAIYIYRPGRETKETHALEGVLAETSEIGIAMVGRSAFVSGGYYKHQLQKSTWEINFSFASKHPISKAAMLFAVSNHTLVSIRGVLIYSIGGVASCSSKDCTQYNILNDYWAVSPSLPIPMQKPIACKFNETLIYCIHPSVHNIYKLDTTKKDEWNCIKINCSTVNFSGFMEFSCIQVNENDILILAAEEKNKAQAFTLDILKGQVIPRSPISRCLNLNSSKLGLKDDKIFLFDSTDKSVVVYESSLDKWKIKLQPTKCASTIFK